MGGRDVDVAFRLTRAQIVAMAPCAEGLVLFDRLVPGGEFRAETSASATMLNDLIPAPFAGWLGPVMLTSTGDGYGHGFGYGDGYGYGDGCGYGHGYGDGYGNGHGYGHGYGDG